MSLIFMAGISVEGLAKTLRFGIVPQHSTSTLAQHWLPLLADISEQTGWDVNFATAKDIPTFEQKLAKGEFDLAYMNPYHYVVFHQAPGYQALVKQKQKKLKGILVTRKDSTFKNIQDLNLETLIFPAPAAFAASILPRAELTQAKVAFVPQYADSHDSVYVSVAKGLFAAGGGAEQTFLNSPSNLQEQLQIIWASPEYPPHAIATHPSLNEGMRQSLFDAFMQASQSALGKSSLKMLKFDGFERANNSDWDDVRALGIDSLDNPNY